MLLIMSQLLLLPTKQPRYCRQPGQRIKTKHKTESSSSGRFFSHPSMAKRTFGISIVYGILEGKGPKICHK